MQAAKGWRVYFFSTHTYTREHKCRINESGRGHLGRVQLNVMYFCHRAIDDDRLRAATPPRRGGSKIKEMGAHTLSRWLAG